MVGFIDHQHIPLLLHDLRQTVDVAQFSMADQMHLADAEVVLFTLVQLAVEREAADQFHQPLGLQGFRHGDQNPFGATLMHQTVDDQTGFNGFAQTDFIGEQGAHMGVFGGFLGDIELMRQQ